MDMQPRNYQPIGRALSNAQAIMLQQHPEAFDCIIYPAKGSEFNEIIAENAPQVTLLDRDERTQEYDPPVLGRAMPAPTQELDFGPTSSGDYENFNSATDAIPLLLSLNVRTHSFVKWFEYATADADSEVLERVVYVAEIKPQGRTLGAGNVYICYPLTALGEVPDTVPESEGEPPSETDTIQESLEEQTPPEISEIGEL